MLWCDIYLLARSLPPLWLRQNPLAALCLYLLYKELGCWFETQKWKLWVALWGVRLLRLLKQMTKNEVICNGNLLPLVNLELGKTKNWRKWRFHCLAMVLSSKMLPFSFLRVLIPIYKGTNPVHKGTTSRPNYHTKVLCLNVIILLQYINDGVHRHWEHSRTVALLIME